MSQLEEESSNDLTVDVALPYSIPVERMFPKPRTSLFFRRRVMCSSQQASGLLLKATQLELPNTKVRSSVHMHGARSAG